MDLFVQKLVYLALFVVLIMAIWKIVKGYITDRMDLKTEIKNFIFIALFLGAAPGLAPGLVEVFVNTGESLVAPAEAIVQFTTSLITDGIQSAMNGR